MTDCLSISSEHKLRQENLAFDADVWYPILYPFTFNTIFLPLRHAEATAIVHYFQSRYLNRNKKQFTTYDVKILQQLEDKISSILQNKTHLFHIKGAFMRLCGRSAKDCEVLDRRKNLKNKYQKELNILLNKGYTLNHQTKLIAIARTQYLQITNAKEAMSQLLSSERVTVDLRDWILYGEPEQIVFRVWNDDVTKDYEFRAFIYNDQMSCISQYDYYGVFPEVMEIKTKLKKMIYEKWKTVHTVVKQSHYVMDFVYLKSKDEVMVIECSPFRRCTGATLYNWDKDRDLLYGVHREESKRDDEEMLKQISFRMRTDDYPNIEHLIEQNWECRYWGTAHPIPYYEWYKNAYSKTEVIISDIMEYCMMHRDKMMLLLLIFMIVCTYIICVYYLDKHWMMFSVIISLTCGISAICYLFAFRNKIFKKKMYVPSLIEHKYYECHEERYTLFVYGTLKSNFHWNHKYLSRGGVLKCNLALTVDTYPMVIGECGVPYLLDIDSKRKDHIDGLKQIKGEIWNVDYETLIGLDQFEGVGKKGHYKRILIDVNYVADNGNKQCIKAFAWFKAKYDCTLLQQTFLDEYTLQFHRQNYSPIRHIQVKQLMYLGEDFNRT